MTDYNKQTVANLRALLKDRGIPLTGLTRKAQIIERLEQHDAENASADPEADAQLDGNDDAEPEALEASPENHPALDATPDEEIVRQREDGDVEPRKDEERTQSQTPPDAPDEASDDKAADPASNGKDNQPTASAETNAPKAVEAPKTEEQSREAQLSAEPPTQRSLPVSPKLETSDQAEDQASLATKDLSLVASFDLPKEEAKTRKRRSVSPPIDHETTRKKLRLDDEHTPGVHLTEAGSVPEVDMQDAAPAGHGDVRGSSVEDREAHGETSNLRDEGESKETVSADPHDLVKREANDQSAAEKIKDAHEDSENKQREVTCQEEPPQQRSASPKPHRDARYQSLFPPAGEPISRPSALPEAVEDDDRAISPALHPATRGLYIRNFMRPLQPALLKNHLISIASPPSSSSPDPQVLELFHLDPIRTHVLALFDSITAAARVRSSLHEAVWPPERTRKPLWADFVPDDKVSEWIEREERESSGSGRMGKRWEVIYEPADVDGGVLASHCEVGARSSFHQPPPREHAGAVSPPRGGAERLPPPYSPTSTTRKATAVTPSGPATEKSFVALDKLFGSTAAKPKLYFLPVSDDLATRRLDELRRCSSHNWRPSDRPSAGAERRYTFDDGDVLVDAGPDAEVGQIRGRGAVRYRGGGGGGPGGPYGRGGGGGGRFRDRGWGPQTGMGGPPPETYGGRRW